MVPCTPRRFSTNRLISSPILTYSLHLLDGQFIPGGREIEESCADLLVFELGDVHIGAVYDPCHDGSTPPRVEFDITISAALTEFSFLEIRDSKTASLCYIKCRRDEDILYLSPLPPLSVHNTTEPSPRCPSPELQSISVRFFSISGQRLPHTRLPKRAGSRQREKPFSASPPSSFG